MYKQWSVDLNDSDAKLMRKQAESSLQPNGEKTSPISVILVSSGSRGNKLLFRYPFQKVSENTSSATCKCSCFLFFINLTLPHQQFPVIDTLQKDCFVFPLPLYTYSIHKELCFSRCVFSSIKAKQRSPYVLNTSGDSVEDQDGDSRYYAKTGIKSLLFLL